MAHYLDFTEGRAIMRDNADWLPTLNYIAFLREIGRYFSVNEMLHMDTYKTRLESGLSFLEFNYLLLQSYDFLHLYRTERCVLQVGGGDQWSNCLGGMDLIRKADGGEAFVLTAPLITDASGQKMGKSTGNGISLNAAAMSPYDYYQFWINVEDANVAQFLGLFTYLPMDEVRRLAALEGADIRQAKEVLAWEATVLTHGEAEAAKARDAARALFSGDSTDGADVPTVTIPTVEFDAGLSLADIFVRAGLATSRGDARRKAAQGGMYSAATASASVIWTSPSCPPISPQTACSCAPAKNTTCASSSNKRRGGEPHPRAACTRVPGPLALRAAGEGRGHKARSRSCSHAPAAQWHPPLSRRRRLGGGVGGGVPLPFTQ